MGRDRWGALCHVRELEGGVSVASGESVCVGFEVGDAIFWRGREGGGNAWNSRFDLS